MEVFPVDWRSQLEAARMAARRLVAAGKVEVAQRNYGGSLDGEGTDQDSAGATIRRLAIERFASTMLRPPLWVFAA